MAAPYKTGLDYYPRRVNFINNRRFIGLRIRWGNAAVGIYEQILDAVYSERGYYISIRDKDRDALIKWLWHSYGNYDGLTCENIDEMLTAMVEEELFDKDLYEKGYLTSQEIQEVFYTATQKRKNIVVDEDIWLLDRERMEELGKRSPIYKGLFEKINDVINPQSKVKESKAKKSKGEQTKTEQTKAAPPEGSLSPEEITTHREEKPPVAAAGGGKEKQINDLCSIHFGIDSYRDMDKIAAWDKDLDINVINEVFKLSAGQGKGFNYANAIIQRLIREHTLTMEEYERKERHKYRPEAPAPARAPQKLNGFINYDQPVYTDEEVEAAIQRKKQRKMEEMRLREQQAGQEEDCNGDDPLSRLIEGQQEAS